MPNLNDNLELNNVTADLEARLFTNERELLKELIQGLRTIRYGSIVLTVHDGKLVEINKTVRIRSRANHK